jgi:hypothetical protein
MKNPNDKSNYDDERNNNFEDKYHGERNNNRLRNI